MSAKTTLETQSLIIHALLTCGNRTTEPIGKPFEKGLRRRDLASAIISRFHTKYTKSVGCWPWQAGRYPRGYGMVNLGRDIRGKQFTAYAARVVAGVHDHAAFGDRPLGDHEGHAMRVNSAHLSLGTQGDNVRDAAQKGHYSGKRQRRKAA